MDFGSGGSVTMLQSGLPSGAFSGLLPGDPFAGPLSQMSIQHQHLQQHQQQQQQHQQQDYDQARFIIQQQLQPRTGNDEPNASQPTCVAPSALTSGPESVPSIATLHHSTPSSEGSTCQDSTFSNPAQTPSLPSSSIKSPPVDPLILNSAPETKPRPTETTEPPKRRRGRPRLSETKSRTARAAPASPTKKETGTQKHKKAVAARRASDASASGADDLRASDDTDNKKNRIRARNREAAYKCRKKKQKGIEELQSQEAVAENIHRNLANEAAMLRGEILMLKNMVLQHGGCGCSFIEEYISGAAANLAHSGMKAAAAAAPSPQKGGGGNMDTQQAMGMPEGDGFVDWKMLGLQSEAELDSAPYSEGEFSGFDEASATHSTRAHSQGATML